TAVSLGTTAPLCIFSTVGATTSTLKCGTSIGKLINYGTDPTLNDLLDHNEAWTHYENAVDWIDTVSNVPDAVHNIKNIGKLTKFTSKYGKQVVKRVSKSESKMLYRQLTEELGETFSHQKTRQFVNAHGLSPRFTPAGVTAFLRSELNSAAR